MSHAATLDDYRICALSFADRFSSQPDLLYYFRHSPKPTTLQYLHYHDAIEVGYCHHGQGIFVLDGEVVPFTAPCATIIYPRQIHRAQSTGSTPSVWSFITFLPEGLHAGDTLLLNLPLSDYLPRTCLTEDPELTVLAAQAASELEREQPGSLECARHLLSALLFRHSRLPRRQDDGTGGRHRCLQKLGPVLQYIHSHYHEDLTIEELSVRFYISPSTLRKWFDRALGEAPLQYLHRIRISVACSLLAGTGQPVMDIGRRVGYLTPSSFNRHFAEICGCSPLAYRRDRQQG